MNALSKSLARNRALRTSAYDGALRTRAAGGIVNIAPAAGFSIFGDQRQQSADRHRYAQNRGWLYAAVNALASAGAMQPAVVAKLLGAPEPTGKLRTKSASKAKHRLAAVAKAHAMRKMTQRARTKAAAEEFEVMTTHPILDVIESPNSVQSRWQFVYCFIASLCLTGTAYIVGGEGEDGKFELYSLPTTWVTPKHEKGPFAEFEVRNPNDPAAEPEIMTRENVAFAMLPNPANPLAAISPAATQATSIRIQEKIEASQDQYFDNGIFPSVIVTVGKDPHPEVAGGVRPRLNAAQRRQVHAAIGKVMSGVSNYGSPAIVDGLIEAITKFSNSADEMGWQQSEEIVKKRILSAFCVHPYILGEAVSVGGYAQVANIEARFFERVNTYLDMLGGCITNFVGAIVGARTKERLLIWWEQKVPNDPSLRWSNLNAARARGDISQNEIRAELGLAPDEDKVEQKIDAATAGIVVQALPLIGGGQMSSEQAQALFEGLGIEPDLAERLAGDGAELQAAQQELQAASAALQAPSADEGATEAEEVEKAVSRLLGGFGRGSKVFCPTGPGGGVDNSCSPKRGGGSKDFPPANPDGKDTLERYRNADGSWTPERQALHDKIVAKVFEGKTPVSNPVAHMMGGGPASGKSSAIEAGGITIPDNTVHVDADAIKSELPEYNEMVAAKDLNAATFAHEESSYLAKRIQAEASNGGYNTMLDGTGDSSVDSVLKKTTAMKAAGQKVIANYVTVDTDVAVERAIARAAKTGRMPPEKMIRECHASVSRVVPELVRQGAFDDFALFDTNDNTTKKIASAKGSDLVIHDQAAWERFLAKGR